MKIIESLVQYLWGALRGPSGAAHWALGVGTDHKVWTGGPFQTEFYWSGVRGGMGGRLLSSAREGAKAGNGLQEQSIVTEL